MSTRAPAATHAPARLEVLPALDGLRGVAAGLVVLTHAAFLTGFGTTGGLAGHLLARGDFGVSIFFALSGFLLHRGLAHHLEATGRVDALAYAARRFARIVPAYWLALAAVVVATRPDVGVWVLNALALHIYAPDAVIASFGQAWSIATELSFYAALPLAVVLLERVRRGRPSRPLVLLVVALVVTSLLPLVTGPADFGEDLLVERWLPWRAPHFLIGMICAEALRAPDHPVARGLSRLARDPVGCLAVAAAAYLASTTPVAGSLTLDPAHGVALLLRTGLATVVAAALVVPLTLGPTSGLSRVLSRPAVRWLGVVSYGLFLWHLPVFTALYAVTGAEFFRGGLAPLLAAGVPISLLLAFLSHQLVEVPGSRLTSRLLAHRRQRRERHERDEHDAQRTLEERRAETAG
ncbi:acyltransferase [Knoellia locipacati]|uniref:Acyltransferase n=1 Tax=Knoellia locipacati TaxID=882824 RepID=A0A512T2E7_9MICO|nr:acyltransferase [Knoellia locipacati]GEQ14395.1 acyltransferase [Knoellia locipacati]